MGFADLDFVQGFGQVCNDGWLQGWHERNGGNLSYRMTDNDVAEAESFFDIHRDWHAIGVADPDLASSYFLVTGSGKYFRNVQDYPEENIGIVEINALGDSYRIVAGLKEAKPTSEFPTHFICHGVRMRATQGKARVVYHAHVTNLIAMTYVLPLEARAISRALWQSATECPVVFPEGVGVVPWMVPGGASIADATAEIMSEYQAVVWSHHGLFCTGDDFDTTFGLMHTIEKAAEIWILIQAASQGRPNQTISDENLYAIAQDFGVKIREEFLDL